MVAEKIECAHDPEYYINSTCTLKIVNESMATIDLVTYTLPQPIDIMIVS